MVYIYNELSKYRLGLFWGLFYCVLEVNKRMVQKLKQFAHIRTSCLRNGMDTVLFLPKAYLVHLWVLPF